jgi:hypothetical protein
MDLALPSPLPQALNQKPTPAELTWLQDHTWLEILRKAIQRLKSYSEIIQPGTDRQEDTTRAKYHLCHHDETPTLPCEQEQDV